MKIYTTLLFDETLNSYSYKRIGSHKLAWYKYSSEALVLKKITIFSNYNVSLIRVDTQQKQYCR